MFLNVITVLKQLLNFDFHGNGTVIRARLSARFVRQASDYYMTYVCTGHNVGMNMVMIVLRLSYHVGRSHGNVT